VDEDDGHLDQRRCGGRLGRDGWRVEDLVHIPVGIRVEVAVGAGAAAAAPRVVVSVREHDGAEGMAAAVGHRRRRAVGGCRVRGAQIGALRGAAVIVVEEEEMQTPRRNERWQWWRRGRWRRRRGGGGAVAEWAVVAVSCRA